MDIDQYISSGALEQYVLGLSSPEECREIEQYAQEYPAIKQKIQRLQSCMQHYAEVHDISPSEVPKKKLMSKKEKHECRTLSIEYKKKLDRASRRPSLLKRYGTWITGMSALVVVGLGFWSFFLFQKQKEAQNQITNLSEKMNQLQLSYESLQSQNQQLLTQYELIKDIGTQQVELRGLEMAPQAMAVIYYNPQYKRAYLNIVNLPSPPTGHNYQLWAEVNGKHLDMGLLPDTPKLKELQNIPFMDDSKGFAISLEKEGGREVPTTSKLCLAGHL